MGVVGTPDKGIKCVLLHGDKALKLVFLFEGSLRNEKDGTTTT